MDILIIDDNHDLCHILKNIFMKFGYSTVTTHNMTDGFLEIKSHHYDILLLDHNLPGGFGLEKLRDIHQIKPVMPVILISACTDNGLKQEALEAGASACLAKPFQYKTLLKLITKFTSTQTLPTQ